MTSSPYPVENVAGAWRPTDTRAAATPNWGRVTPFALTTGSQFRPGLPGGAKTYAELLRTQEYADAVEEVKELGGAAPTAETPVIRTPEQEQIAWFWANDIDRTYKPPGQLYEHTQIVAAQQGVPVDAKVKLFAQVALALADASIVAWDAKFLSGVDLWRPESAIRNAGADGNPQTFPDPDWKPLSADAGGVNFSPPFPAYVSGHATFGYAWAHVMSRWFGRDDIAFTATTDDPHARGVTRAMPGFLAAGRENARSRTYLGVHFDFDADESDDAGTRLADWTVEHALHYNDSDTELLYRHEPNPGSPAECDELGRRLDDQHRWGSYRCDWRPGFTAYDLYVS